MQVTPIQVLVVFLLGIVSAEIEFIAVEYPLLVSDFLVQTFIAKHS